MNPRILRTAAAATYVGLSKSTLEKLRVYGGGPPFVRLGRRAVGYDVSALDAWLNSRVAASTSTPREVHDDPAA